jgi:hypothetical protein
MSMSMLPLDAQLAIEHTYSRKFLDKYIDKEIRDNPEMEAKVHQGVELLNTWLSGTYYESKQARLEQIKMLELEPLVRAIFIGVAYCQTPELFTSVSAQLASRLKFDDKADCIRTVAEIMAVLCNTDAYDIVKTNKQASLMVQSRIPLSQKLIDYVVRSAYLPPMVCMPKPVRNNYESGYLTHNDCLVLGKGNGHDGDLCLDVINKQNSVELKLDLEFLSSVEEEHGFNPEEMSIENLHNWEVFKARSQEMYRLMIANGNRFYLINKVDKRGRIYAQGYHINTQGSSYKKAMIELANEEVVQGVPN